MYRYIEKICPNCGRMMHHHICMDPNCEGEWYCSEHRGGCGYVTKKKRVKKRRVNWNPYKEKNNNKKD